MIGLFTSLYLFFALNGNRKNSFVDSRRKHSYSRDLPHSLDGVISYQQIQDDREKIGFNISTGDDVLIFLHVQKTAGTSFERFLVKKLNIDNPCRCDLSGRKRCNCQTRNGKIWLFSRYSTGWVHWAACGLHADFTQLIVSACVNDYFLKKEGKKKNRLYLTTFLREPIDRFISEYSHVRRGAAWNRSRHFCNGRIATRDELPLCYEQLPWNPGLDEFIDCPYNLAFNRQTRMLADLTLVNCYNKSMEEHMRNEIMLESAKKNLRSFAFFGIKEMMKESQFVFKKTFGLGFNGSLAEWNTSKSAHIEISQRQMDLIRDSNQMDLQLYEFAIELFQQRLISLGWPYHTS